MLLKDLQEMAKQRGLEHGGKKADLIERLMGRSSTPGK